MQVSDRRVTYRPAMKNVFAAAAALLALSGCGAPVDVSDHAQSDVIDTCQTSVRAMLKDPDSARFADWSAWQTGSSTGGNLSYSAKGMVNARNGFGGYSGDQPYACDATVTADHVRAQARTGS